MFYCSFCCCLLCLGSNRALPGCYLSRYFACAIWEAARLEAPCGIWGLRTSQEGLSSHWRLPYRLVTVGTGKGTGTWLLSFIASICGVGRKEGRHCMAPSAPWQSIPVCRRCKRAIEIINRHPHSSFARLSPSSIPSQSHYCFLRRIFFFCYFLINKSFHLRAKAAWLDLLNLFIFHPTHVFITIFRIKFGMFLKDPFSRYADFITWSKTCFVESIEGWMHYFRFYLKIKFLKFLI